MSWLITPQQKIDPDAAVYLSRVEAADGQVLEAGVRTAIDSFVLGCKADGIWGAIKASCILAGARTLAGALVPLAGTAPTNVSFVSGDYNRKTGLVGDGSTKRLNTNRTNQAEPQNSRHLSCYAVTLPSANLPIIGQERTTADGASFIYQQITRLANAGSNSYVASGPFIGISRSNSSSYTLRNGSSSASVSVVSVVPADGNMWIFWDSGGIGTYSNARLAFYSIGEALDLAKLDARVTTLVNALSAAIP